MSYCLEDTAIRRRLATWSTFFKRRDELPAVGRSDQFRVGPFHFCYRPSRFDLPSSIYDQLQKQLRLLLRDGWTLQQDRLRRDNLKSAPSFWPVHRIENLSVLLLIMVKSTWGYAIDLSMNATRSHFQQRSANPIKIGRGPHCCKRMPCLQGNYAPDFVIVEQASTVRRDSAVKLIDGLAGESRQCRLPGWHRRHIRLRRRRALPSRWKPGSSSMAVIGSSGP